MLKRLLQPHSIIITILIFLFIWVFQLLSLNMHYLDPFNNGIKDYEITDIVYTYLSRQPQVIENQIILVNSGQPDRQKIAALVNKLKAAQAKVIGLDFFFEKTTDSPTDTLLHQSIKDAGNVVLACELHDSDGNYEQFENWIGVDTFFANYATLGYVNYPSNETKTIRIFSPQEKVGQHDFPAFTTAIIRKFDPKKVENLLARNNPFERIYYIGDKSDFIRYDQDQVLDSLTIEELTMVVKDKIILVGYAVEDIWANPLTDRHYTPLNKNYMGKSIPDMYGVVIHANVISMILQGNYIRETPKWVSRFLAVIFCFLNVILIHWIYHHFHEAFHGITRVLQIAEFIILFLVIALLFYYFRLRLNFSLGIFALLIAYDIIMIYESLIKKRIPILAKLPYQIEFTKSARPPEITDSQSTLSNQTKSNIKDDNGNL